jgi:tetratricopeptide (TPR) repeat protein
MTNEASALLDLGRLDEAGTLLEEALAAAEAVLGPDHPITLVTLASLGDLQAMRGQHVEAAATLARAADGSARAFGPDHPTVLEYRRQAGDEYFRGGLLEDARRSYHDVLADQRRVLGDGSVEVHQTLYNLACLESAAGNIDESLGHLEEAVRLGYAPPELLADPDLASLHGEPRFERIAAAIRVAAPGS